MAEHQQRAELLRRAIGIAQQELPQLLHGDAVDNFPAALAKVREDSTLCLIRIFTQLSPEARDRLASLLLGYSARRDVFLITSRPHHGKDSELQLVSFVNGLRTEKRLAYFENHGEWLEWLDVDQNLTTKDA